MNFFAREPEVIGPPRHRTRRLAATLFVLLLIGGGLALIYQRSHPTADPAEAERGAGAPVPVVAATAARQDVAIYLDGLGTVQAYASVTVHSMIDGPLIEVGFREGQEVRPGDVLARIDPRPYQATLDQVTARKAQDEANLANARLDLARYSKLAATAYTSAQTADTQRATVAQLEAQVKQDQASIDSARTQLSYTTITAPIAGRTGIRQVDAGNIIHAADIVGLVVIATLQPISVVFTLPQQALPQVTAAMRQSHEPLPVLALPQGDVTGSDPAAVLDRGTLAVIDNQVDPTTGTIKLKATFPNPALTLWPGGFVNVRLLVATLRGAVTVPPAAVQRGPAGAFVYVVTGNETTGNETVRRRMIAVGHEDVQASIVTDGLQSGEQVVIDGASRLTDGAHVAVSEGNRVPKT